MSPFRPPVSASKISVPDSNVRDRFDDWVGSWRKLSLIEKRPFLRGSYHLFSAFRVSAANSGLSAGFWPPSLCIQKFRSWRLEFRGGTDEPAPGNRLLRCAASEFIAGSIRAFRTVGSIPRELRGAARRRCREANDLRLRL